MKKVLKSALAAALLVVAGQPAVAKGFAAEANGARAHGRWGGELGVGYRLEVGQFRLTPAVGAFLYKGDNDRYYMDNNGGNPRCRDSTNGRYAETSECNNVAVKAYGRVEATVVIPLFAEVGAGARFSSEKVRPYGTVAVPLAPFVKLKGNAGPKYYALGLTLGY